MISFNYLRFCKTPIREAPTPIRAPIEKDFQNCSPGVSKAHVNREIPQASSINPIVVRIVASFRSFPAKLKYCLPNSGFQPTIGTCERRGLKPVFAGRSSWMAPPRSCTFAGLLAGFCWSYPLHFHLHPALPDPVLTRQRSHGRFAQIYNHVLGPRHTSGSIVCPCSQ